jgi:hypothetical protein
LWPDIQKLGLIAALEPGWTTADLNGPADLLVRRNSGG